MNGSSLQRCSHAANMQLNMRPAACHRSKQVTLFLSSTAAAREHNACVWSCLWLGVPTARLCMRVCEPARVACAHSVRTLIHDASSHCMTQTLEQLLKALCSLSLFISHTDSHQNEKPRSATTPNLPRSSAADIGRFVSAGVFAYGWNTDVFKPRQKRRKKKKT